ncbi:MAG: BolA/IbaG family iron-sulfur metabolism protein [bacterium]|nr:BolA/IbaG family iron-sulfur metabolism protein [bacterium]
MTVDDVKKLILAALPEAEVEVRDTTGTGDHFSAKIAAKEFAGKNLMAQHRLVMDAVKTAMAGPNAPLHAFDIKTKAL